jgi:putative membrane protein
MLIVQFLMAIELMRDSLERQLRLGTLSDERVRGIVREYAASRWHYGTHARGGDTSASAGADAGAGLVSGIAGAAVLISGGPDEADGAGAADGGGNGSDNSDIEQTQQLPALHDAVPHDDGHRAKRDTNTAKPTHDPTHEERGHTA